MFDPRRFARLAAAEWVENRRAWAWFLAVLVMVHFVLVLVLMAGDEAYASFTTNKQSGLFVVGLFLTAPVFAGRYFQALSRRGSAQLALLRPASTLEKWLLALLVVGVAYPLAYSLVFYVCELPAVLVAQGQAADALAALPAALEGSEVDRAVREHLAPSNYAVFLPWASIVQVDDWIAIGLAVNALQAFAVFGSLWFERMPFLKTLLAGFLVLLACLLLAQLSSSDFGPLFGYWDEVLRDRPELGIGQSVVFPLVWLGGPSLMWLAAYRALREREAA
jgi:hypothetical protein